MNIIVCIKQVPDTTEVRIDPVKGTLVRDGVPSIMNPDDKAGLEVALSIKDKYDSKITVVTMGPPQAEEILREAYAMGVDEAILITDRAFGGSDTWATSSTLAAAIKKLDYDLIIMGRQAIDGDTAQVGPETAEHLGLPNISYAQSVEIDGNEVIVMRHHDNCIHKIRAKMPLVVTTMSEYNVPRYMTPGGIFDAYQKEIIHLNRLDIDVKDQNIGSKGSPTKVSKSFPKSVKEPGMKIEKSTDESVQFILDKLKETYII